MSELIKIENIDNGTSPFFVYVCDLNEENCIYIDEIEENDVPYEFEIPTGYQNSNFLVRLLDQNNCKILKYFN